MPIIYSPNFNNPSLKRVENRIDRTTGHVQDLSDALHNAIHTRISRLHLTSHLVQQLRLVVELILHRLRDVLEAAHTTAYQIYALVLLFEQLLYYSHYILSKLGSLDFPINPNTHMMLHLNSVVVVFGLLVAALSRGRKRLFGLG